MRRSFCRNLKMLSMFCFFAVTTVSPYLHGQQNREPNGPCLSEKRLQDYIDKNPNCVDPKAACHKTYKQKLDLAIMFCGSGTADNGSRHHDKACTFALNAEKELRETLKDTCKDAGFATAPESCLLDAEKCAPAAEFLAYGEDYGEPADAKACPSFKKLAGPALKAEYEASKQLDEKLKADLDRVQGEIKDLEQERIQVQEEVQQAESQFNQQASAAIEASNQIAQQAKEKENDVNSQTADTMNQLRQRKVEIENGISALGLQLNQAAVDRDTALSAEKTRCDSEGLAAYKELFLEPIREKRRQNRDSKKHLKDLLLTKKNGNRRLAIFRADCRAQEAYIAAVRAITQTYNNQVKATQENIRAQRELSRTLTAQLNTELAKLTRDKQLAGEGFAQQQASLNNQIRQAETELNNARLSAVQKNQAIQLQLAQTTVKLADINRQIANNGGALIQAANKCMQLDMGSKCAGSTYQNAGAPGDPSLASGVLKQYESWVVASHKVVDQCLDGDEKKAAQVPQHAADIIGKFGSDAGIVNSFDLDSLEEYKYQPQKNVTEHAPYIGPGSGHQQRTPSSSSGAGQ